MLHKHFCKTGLTALTGTGKNHLELSVDMVYYTFDENPNSSDQYFGWAGSIGSRRSAGDIAVDAANPWFLRGWTSGSGDGFGGPAGGGGSRPASCSRSRGPRLCRVRFVARPTGGARLGCRGSARWLSPQTQMNHTTFPRHAILGEMSLAFRWSCPVLEGSLDESAV